MLVIESSMLLTDSPDAASNEKKSREIKIYPHKNMMMTLFIIAMEKNLEQQEMKAEDDDQNPRWWDQSHQPVTEKASE